MTHAHAARLENPTTAERIGNAMLTRDPLGCTLSRAAAGGRAADCVPVGRLLTLVQQIREKLARFSRPHSDRAVLEFEHDFAYTRGILKRFDHARTKRVLQEIRQVCDSFVWDARVPRWCLRMRISPGTLMTTFEAHVGSEDSEKKVLRPRSVENRSLETIVDDKNITVYIAGFYQAARLR